MSLFDKVMGALKQGPEAGSSSLLDGVVGLLQDGQSGGLRGLVTKLSENGLGEAVASWVGTGSNLPVSGDDLMNALGTERVQSLAQQAGLSVPEASGQLATILPKLIDSLTPGGQIPEDGLLAKGIAMVRKGLG